MKRAVEYSSIILAIVAVTVAAYILIREVQSPTRNPPIKDCSSYTTTIEEWIAAYNGQEKALMQCQKDLATIQEELHHDSICSDEQCVIR